MVDTEWGAFGDNGSLDFLKTQLDLDIDRRSNHVHSFTCVQSCFRFCFFSFPFCVLVLSLSSSSRVF